MINVNFKSSTPIYEQVKESIKKLVFKDALKYEDKLPSIRELSCLLTINPNTIRKAYSNLENEGIIEIRKGCGTYISENAKNLVKDEYLSGLREDVVKVIYKTKELNMDFQQLIEMEKKIYCELGEDGDARSQ